MGGEAGWIEPTVLRVCGSGSCPLTSSRVSRGPWDLGAAVPPGHAQPDLSVSSLPWTLWPALGRPVVAMNASPGSGGPPKAQPALHWPAALGTTLLGAWP